MQSKKFITLLYLALLLISTPVYAYEEVWCSWIDYSTNAGHAAKPRGIATNVSGTAPTDFWICDDEDDMIHHYDSNWNYIGNCSIASFASQCTDIATNATNEPVEYFFLTNNADLTVHIVNTTCDSVSSFSVLLDGFFNIQGIDVNDTHIFILDEQERKIGIYTHDGTFVSSFSISNPHISVPRGLRFNTTHYFIIDTVKDGITVLNSTGSEVNYYNLTLSGITDGDAIAMDTKDGVPNKFWIGDVADSKVYLVQEDTEAPSLGSTSVAYKYLAFGQNNTYSTSAYDKCYLDYCWICKLEFPMMTYTHEYDYFVDMNDLHNTTTIANISFGDKYSCDTTNSWGICCNDTTGRMSYATETGVYWLPILSGQYEGVRDVSISCPDNTTIIDTFIGAGNATLEAWMPQIITDSARTCPYTADHAKFVNVTNDTTNNICIVKLTTKYVYDGDSVTIKPVPAFRVTRPLGLPAAISGVVIVCMYIYYDVQKKRKALGWT